MYTAPPTQAHVLGFPSWENAAQLQLLVVRRPLGCFCPRPCPSKRRPIKIVGFIHQFTVGCRALSWTPGIILAPALRCSSGAGYPFQHIHDKFTFPLRWVPPHRYGTDTSDKKKTNSNVLHCKILLYICSLCQSSPN